MSLLLRRMDFSLPPMEEFEEKEMENATISDKGMSAVAHYIMVHYSKKRTDQEAQKEIQAQRWAIHS
jgi:hypothetical protein